MKNKEIIVLLIVVLANLGIAQCQENVKSLNGLWQNNSDRSVYYLLFDGNYLSFYVNNSSTLEGLELGKYGFYPDSINVDNLRNISLNEIQLSQYKLGFNSSNGGIIGYEFEIGDRLLNLYNQNDFFYEKLYVLPQKIIAQIRVLARNKKIDLDNFIYSTEFIGAPKAIIYIAPNTKSKMYLLKGDAVKVIEEKGNWLKIEYKGKKIINGWIRKQDLE